MGKRWTKDDFSSRDVLVMAQDLIGCYLLSSIEGSLVSGRIVETEAYRGKDDKACHAFGYKKTKRTSTMYLPAGHSYVYLCYGIHHLFNIVASDEGEPDAVLIRALEPVNGLEKMMERRHFSRLKPQLTAGPGVLSKAMGIDKRHNALDLSGVDSPLWVEYPDSLEGFQIEQSPRIGIAYAEECVSWPWRFTLKNNPYLSRIKS